ncbi:uncharacterized protein AB9W97_003160 [Spinachia spinachia]
MDHSEEEEEEKEEKETRPSADELLPTGSHYAVKQPTQGQEVNSVEEWDTDLETDNGTCQKHSLPAAERYLEACRRTGCVPVSSYLRQLGEANLNLTHYGVGRLGAKALAISLQVWAAKIPSSVHIWVLILSQRDSMSSCQNLSDNQLHLEGAQVISKMLLDNCYITTIKLSGNHFDDSAAKYLADALKVDYVVKELDLSHNNIFDAGGEHLSHMLGTAAHIVLRDSRDETGLSCRDPHLLVTCLTVTAIFISMSKESNLLFPFPQVNSTLQKLRLAWNGFGPVEAQSLGHALKQNSTLVRLDLSGNLLDDRAAARLGEGLAANATLRVLELSRNPLTKIGALSLLRTVTENPSSAVEEMDVSSVSVCETFVELLEEARQRRPALDVRYSVMSSITRNLSALQIFHKFLAERNESIVDFFRSLDDKGTKKVPTCVFRKAVKEANVPLDRRQLEWLINKFDKKCTASIVYRSVCEGKRAASSYVSIIFHASVFSSPDKTNLKR